MNHSFLQNTSISNKIIISLLIIIVGFIVFFMGGLLLAIPLFKLDFASVLREIGSPNESNMGLFKYLQAMQSVGLFIVPSLTIAYFFGSSATQYLKLDSFPKWSFIVVAIIMMWSFIPFINFLAEWNEGIHFPKFLAGVETWMRDKEDAATHITKLFVNVSTIDGLLINLLVIGLIPAVGEELLFRGVIQRFFVKITGNIHWGIFIAAFIFSAIHFQFLGFVPRLLLGMIFGYILVWSGSLWLPIIAHFVNNATAVVFFYLISSGKLNIDIDKIGSSEQQMYLAIPSFIIVGVALFWMHRNKVKQSNLI